MFDEDTFERELSCGVCLELYTDPLQLSCMHTFCKSCLKALLQSEGNKRLKCPDCRKNSDLGRGGIESLKRNFKLASIVDIYRQAVAKLVAEKEANRQEEQTRKSRIDDHKKDYAFVSSLIQKSHDESDGPFEPHIIDDLWGTFKRTARRDSHLSNRPPAPLPPRSETSSRSPPQLPRAPRPLPTIPHRSSSTDDTTSMSDQTGTRLPPAPSPESTNPARMWSRSPLPPPPPQRLSDDSRAIPSAPPYLRLSDNQSNIPDEIGDLDFMDGSFDIAASFRPSLPPVPPRRSFPSQPSAFIPDKNLENRPPIPAPRGNVKAPALPPRENMPALKTKPGSVQNGRKPLPKPKGRQS
ncbi:WAS/WASL-interacting protein family member 1-like [Haliotis rubra]|uniref:WAS/WASL-interacting protein family member 1-like n=1 Tax=Haliotis rubra TaxID=36100 RepID=UPI001EE52845|nr:WAS/WASL-interacting protein family member 1-like [Haliotis rubra]